MRLNIHWVDGSPPQHTHPPNSLLRVFAATGSYSQSGRLLRQRGDSSSKDISSCLGDFELLCLLLPALSFPPLLPSELGLNEDTRLSSMSARAVS